LKPGTEWIDLVEECPDNCFSFYGVTLDPELNRKIDEAFAFADKDEPVKAMMSFKNIAESGAARNKGIEGFIYLNIIRLEKQTGNNVKAAEWYAKLKSSQAPRLQQYLKYLNDQGIKY
jgi:hypothetical protein